MSAAPRRPMRHFCLGVAGGGSSSPNRRSAPRAIWSRADFADVDPFGGGELSHPRWRGAYRAVGRARGRHNLAERLKAKIAINGQRCVRAERPSAATGVTGTLGALVA